MKILVLTDRFHPEITAPSVRILDHARLWVEWGHEVTVVTCVPNFPRGEVFPGYRNRLYAEESLEGIRVVRVASYMTANEGFFRRSVDYASFMLSATSPVERAFLTSASNCALFQPVRLLGLSDMNVSMNVCGWS